MTTTTGSAARGFSLASAGRFARHALEMCVVMCAVAVPLNLGFYAVASALGYPDILDRAPEIWTVFLAVSVSLPMLVWMRWRGHEWRPTIEMAGSTIVVAALLLAAGWLGLITQQTAFLITKLLACPLMIAVMLFRPGLYAGSGHGRHMA